MLVIKKYINEGKTMIFICFSHVERFIIAQSLTYHLKNYGYTVWYDYDELFIGDNGDYLNFEDGLYKAKYIVIILSKALFVSPCAVTELIKISELYKTKKVSVIPLLYNITSEEIPMQFSWISEVIYANITNESGTLDIATQISAKYLEDIVRNNNYIHLNNVSYQNNPPQIFLNKLINCYTQIDHNNINARATVLYIFMLYLKNHFDLSNAPKFCFKSLEYLFKFTYLNIPINFKELSVMENSITILLNYI